MWPWPSLLSQSTAKAARGHDRVIPRHYVANSAEATGTYLPIYLPIYPLYLPTSLPTYLPTYLPK